jgi:hypothetical protein
MLSSLVNTTEWSRAEAAVHGWIRERRRLGEIAFCARSVHQLGPDLLEEILSIAIETGDGGSAASVIAAASERYSAEPIDSLKRTALAGVKHLGTQGDFRWVGILGSRFHTHARPLLESLTEEETRDLLAFLVRHQAVDYATAEIIEALGPRWPEAVIDFFGERLKFELAKEIPDYEAVPYRLEEAVASLADHPGPLVLAARGWFDLDRSLFEYRGGRLIKAVYPGFSQALEDRLVTRVRTGDANEIRFVLGIMRAYDGEGFLHPLCKEITAALPAEDELLNLVSIVVDSMGVTMGEFGHVQGLVAKKASMEEWLQDPRPGVQSFARRHIRSLDLQIAAEQRRAEEELAMRRLEYDTPAEAAE